MGRGKRGVGEVVEQAELFAQQEGAVEALVDLADLVQRGELADALVLGRFEQRPAGALDPAPVRRVRSVVLVPFVAAARVGRARAEPADVERIEADLRGWDGGADRA